MKKQYFTATATMNNGSTEWDVVISSLYESVEEAEAGINRFKTIYGDMVIKTAIK